MRSPQTGSIQMMDLYSTEQRVSSAPVSVNAHKNELVCLAINQQGSMVATASTKVIMLPLTAISICGVQGTLIRIWDTARRVQLVELRRGADQVLSTVFCTALYCGALQARIYCVNFSCTDEWLCCSSDKGTVHIFALQDYRLNKAAYINIEK